MKAKVQLKNRAVRLRKKGFSYLEIKKRLGTPKSTLSYWLKNVLLSPEQKERLYTKQISILTLGSQSHHLRREREIRSLTARARKEIISPLTDEVIKLLGACIYWAEGNKQGSLCITNSDPALILFMVYWIHRVFRVKPSGLKAWLNIYQQQNERELISFWSDLTGIPPENFGKTFIKPANNGFKKNNLYYGTIKVNIPKSTNLRYHTLGWLTALMEELDPKLKLTIARWQKIKEVTRPINLV